MGISSMEKGISLRIIWYAAIILLCVIPAIFITSYLAGQLSDVLVRRSLDEVNDRVDKIATQIRYEIVRLHEQALGKSDSVSHLLANGRDEEVLRRLLSSVIEQDDLQELETQRQNNAVDTIINDFFKREEAISAIRIVDGGGVTYGEWSKPYHGHSHGRADNEYFGGMKISAVTGSEILKSKGSFVYPEYFEEGKCYLPVAVLIGGMEPSLGIMIVEIDTDIVIHNVLKSMGAMDGAFYILNHQGMFLAGSENIPVKQAAAVTSQNIEFILNGHSWNIADEVSGLTGTNVYSVSNYIDATDWYVVGEVQKDIVSGPVIRSIMMIVGIIGLLVVALSGLGLVAINMVTRPIRNLVKEYKRIASGDYSEVRIKSVIHEVNYLTEGFNNTLDSIRRSQSQLRSSEARFSGIIQAAKNGIIAINKHNNIILFNRKAEEIFGYTFGEVVGHSADILIPSRFRSQHADYYSFVADKSRKAPVQSDDRTIIQGMHSDGSEFPMSTSVSYMNMNDELIHIVLIEDMTERLRIENELRRAYKMNAMGQLAGGIAHDFNNIIASINGFAELTIEVLKEAGQEDIVGDYLNEIVKSSTRAKDLTAQLLVFGRDKKPETASITAGESLQEVIKLMRPVIPSSIEIHDLIDDRTAKVRMTDSEFHQIIMNLMINARDAMNGKGKLYINLTLEDAVPALRCDCCGERFSGDFVVISIRDTGMGMSDDIKKNIFEPYFTTKEVGKGTGMGMSVIQGLLHQYSAHIIVNSQVNIGTEFVIYMPIYNNRQEDHSVRQSVQVSDKRPGAVCQGATVLIVDDEQSLVKMLSDFLKLRGLRVKELTSSGEALSWYESHSAEVDIVVTDQVMPEMSGFEMAQKMLAINRGLPVVLCTGYCDDISAETALASGIKEFLHKPVTLEHIYSVITSLLHNMHGKYVA